MIPARPARILVADDEPDLLELMKETLTSEGYEVQTAEDGNQALTAIRANPPDIAILDLRMPKKDGFGVCSALRGDPMFAHLPVIILSASGTRDIHVQGLDLGADDFIDKPVDMVELSARVRMLLKRTRQGLDANPLTRLPGNVSIESNIENAIGSRKPMAVLYLDLNQFKAYNDVYGYDAGDRVIKATGSLLMEIVRDDPSSGDFLGHIGGDDFIILTSPERMEIIAQKVIKRFDAMSPGFYNEEDRRRKKIISTDRRGQTVEFPLLSIAVGICHNQLRPLSSYAQVSQLGAELKKHAKKQTRSSYVVDRRRD